MAGVTVSTVYDIGMAKYVFMQLNASSHGGDTPHPLKIRADKIQKAEGTSGKMILTLGGQQVGEFQGGTIAGWWIEDTDQP